jgi:methylmalonyl-CoA/ethylmalonyl-CoA epimerase
MIKRISHIGVVVKDLDRAIAKFKGFGLTCAETTELKELGVEIAFFPISDSQMEFICFTDPEKGKESIVRAQKGAINHLCFEVDSLEKTIQDFEKTGAKLLKGYPRHGAHGRVAFFDPETTENVLIEIYSPTPE